MKRALIALSLIMSPFLGMSQFSTQVSVVDASCWNSSDGSYTIDSIAGCFAPLTINVDSSSFSFSTLQNNGYSLLNHGSGSSDDRAYSVWGGMTSSGPVYIATGTFSGSLTFDSLTLNATGLQDMFVACFDAETSSLMWAFSGGSGGSTYTAGYGITGSEDKAYVTGYFTGTAVFDTTAITSTGAYQGYVMMIDLPTGGIDTIVQVGGAGTDEGFNISYDDGHVYVVGDYSGAISLAGNSFTSAGNQDAFIVCLDSTLGTEVWSAAGGGSAFDVFSDVVARNGKAYVTGQFSGNVTFGSLNASSSGGDEFYVMRIDSSGTFDWITQGGSTGDDYCTTIDIDSDGDRLYVGGTWVGSMIFGGQLYNAGVSNDGFIGYLDTAGILDTIYALSGTGPESVLDLQSVDDDYLVFVARFGGSVTYADSTFASNGNIDAFVGKIGADQHEIWGKNFGGSNNDIYASVRTGAGNRLHTCGFFEGDCSAYQAGLISAGADDAIVSNGSLFGIADTSITVTGLSGGSYVYSMTDSAGNTWFDTVMVGAPDSFDISAVVIDASSPTATDGSIDLSVSGGTPGYTYFWSNGATSQDLDSIGGGTYCVTITDSVGCTDTACFFVDSVLVIGPMTVTASISDLACFGDSSGSIDLTVAGGLPPYSFAWSNGATTEDLNGIQAGTYTVTVTDNDTASFIDSFMVTQPDEIIISGVITPPSSGSANDGEIDVTVSGGVPPYAYSWSNGETTQDITGLMIGSYTITVSDTSGCSAVQSFFVDTIASLSLVSQATDVTCINTDNGAIALTVIGGVPPFTFSWSNGETTEDLSGLAAGLYTVTVTDSVAQTATLTDSVGSNPIHPDPTVGPITGATSAQAFTNYNYSVPTSVGSLFDWTLSGGMLISSASNAASVQWYGGPSGVVYVTETDANGCMAMDSLEVSILFVGIGESDEDLLAIFPNPVSDHLNVSVPSGFQNLTIELYDLTGRVVFTRVLDEGLERLEMTHVPSGSYVMTLSHERHHWTQKIVVK